MASFEINFEPKSKQIQLHKQGFDILIEIDGISKKGGPADKAGMKKGDIIIEINRKKVRNIYDYMARLAELKHGDEVMVKIIRNKIDIE